ncbi:MAG TPA: amidohydrolase family protein, partial [Novosphingobium sp.]|nr:amidohydrolase family protein [Novosphingobium sp.]
RRALGGVPPDFSSISADLAACGVTGLTDMTPHNDPGMARHFAAQIAGAALKQNCDVAGTLALADAAPDGWTLGPAKLHLHEAALPEFGETVAFVRSAHGQGRNVAVHCVSEVELVFALAALEEAGASCGDRIEHASVASLELVERIAALGLAVCVQSHFVFERGDRYLAEVEPRHHPDLYRLRTLIDHGVPLAGGSDAPFGEADPWAAMRAATKRYTAVGQVMGPMEALTPEQALALYLASPHDLVQQRKVEAGAAADLVLLDRPWSQARERLVREDVALTIIAGRVVHDRVDQPPVQRLPGVETPA